MTEERDPALIACLRLLSVFTGSLISGRPIGPYFLEVLRDEIPKASSEEEAGILADFVEGVERILARQPTAPKLTLIHGPLPGHVKDQGVAP
jgi:hypothetical protein